MGNRTNFFNAGLINVLLEALYSNIYTVVTMYNWYQWIHTCTSCNSNTYVWAYPYIKQTPYIYICTCFNMTWRNIYVCQLRLGCAFVPDTVFLLWHFRPLFFHDWNPSGPLINRLKYFQIRFKFRRNIWII